MSRYAIADFLPLHARQAACGHNYHRRFGAFGIVGSPVGPRDEQGFCPLGRALQAMEQTRSPIPVPTEVRDAVIAYWSEPGHGEPPVPLNAAGLRLEAQAFIQAWDHGQIADLAEVLGVTR